MTKANQTDAPATPAPTPGPIASAEPSRVSSASNAPAAATAARPPSGVGTARAVAGAPSAVTGDAPISATPAALGAAPAVPPVRPLQPARMTLHIAGQSWNVWDVVAERGTAPEWLLSEEYWTHVGAKLAVWDEIIVRLEDGSAKFRLTVQSAGKRFARVAIEAATHLNVGTPSTGALPAGYGVEWSGPHTKYRVRRGSEVLKDGFDTEAQANGWLAGHLRAA